MPTKRKRGTSLKDLEPVKRFASTPAVQPKTKAAVEPEAMAKLTEQAPTTYQPSPQAMATSGSASSSASVARELLKQQQKSDTKATQETQSLDAFAKQSFSQLKKTGRIFYLSYQPTPSAQPIRLKLKFTPTNLSGSYYSYVFSPREYEKRHAPTNAGNISYVRLEVFDIENSQQKTKFLDIWFSINAKHRFGELRDLNSSPNTKGRGIAIFDFLDKNFLHIDTVYTCDSSRLVGYDSDGVEVGERDPGNMVFRVPLGIENLNGLYERQPNGKGQNKFFRFFPFAGAEMGAKLEKNTDQSESELNRARLRLHQQPILNLYRWHQALADKDAKAKCKFLDEIVAEHFQVSLQEYKENDRCPITLAQVLAALRMKNKKERGQVDANKDDYLKFYQYFLLLSDDQLNNLVKGGCFPESDVNLVPKRDDKDDLPYREAVKELLKSDDDEIRKKMAALQLNGFLNDLSKVVFTRFLIREKSKTLAQPGGAAAASASSSAPKPPSPTH